MAEEEGSEKVPPSEDPERKALEASVVALQQAGATRRCIDLVVKRSADLSKESKADFDTFVRRLEMPGYRVGKAPAGQLPQFAAKYPQFGRRVFRQLFTFWMELYAGLSDTVSDVALKTVPSVDFATGEWSSIDAALPAVAARMPRHTPEDLRLALFAHRFGSLIEKLTGRGAPREEDAISGTGESENVQSLPGALCEPARPSLDAAALDVVATFHEFIQDLQALDETSAVWDETVAEFGERLADLRARKLAARDVLNSREVLEEALAELQTQRLLSELEFLGLRKQCERWSAENCALTVLAHLSTQIRALAKLVEAHGVARVDAQHATNDEDLEAHTARRRDAKRDLLAALAEIDRKQLEGEQSPEAVAEPSKPSQGSEEPSREDLLAESTGTPDAVDVAPAPLGPNKIDLRPDGSAPAGAAPPDAAQTPEAASPPPGEVASGASSAQPLVPAGTPVPPAPEAEKSSLREVPVELTSYTTFRDHYRIGSASQVEIGPWRSPTFGDALCARILSALAMGPSRAWTVLTLARGLEEMGLEAPVDTADVRAAASLWATPSSPSAGSDADRCERIRARGASFGSTSQRIALALEALRPAFERQLLSHEVDALVEAAEFESGALRVVVHRLLTAHAQGHDALALLRGAKRPSLDQSRDKAIRLEHARKDLQTLVTRVWSAAGGRVQRTHCRRAWSDFVEFIQPSLTRLYPPPRGDDSWAVGQALQDVDGFEGSLDTICEKHGAKFDDKRHMLRTASEIADAARRVIDARREQLSASDTRRLPVALPELELEQLEATNLPAAEEEFARLLLLRVLHPMVTQDGETHPLAITIADICARPDLLRVIRDVPPESVEALRRPTGAFAYADDLTEPVRAAAILLGSEEGSDTPSLDTLVSSLERTQRGALLGLIVQALDDRMQRRVHAERTDALGRLAMRVSQITQDVDDLSSLGNRLAGEVRAIRDAARVLVESDDVRLDTRLTEVWLERVHDTARRLASEHVGLLEAEASRREDHEEIHVALTRGHFGRAIRLLWGHGGTEVRSTRQTEWRDDAQANREVLQRSFYANTDAKLKPLVDAWRTGVKGDAVRADRTLRTEFVRVVTDGRNMDRDSAPAHIAIPIAAINADLARDQLMPTWMPQLARFGRLVVLTPPVSPEQPSFRQATMSRATEFAQDLVVFLAPRLTGIRRGETLAEMRRRGTAAALVDDVDMLRLVNPGGQRPHPMLGLLEIILEQQRRAVLSPFELPEGSHVRLEMYVGRRDKAREIARTANYSRLFSGRKLGKSALLRFIERTEGGLKLPSGNTLRVVYVPAVGVESEAAMVDAIVASLETALNVRFDRPSGTEPADKLGTVLSGYLDSHRSESLLLVLDEADVFFERQLAEYDERRERCLSFQMRSRFTATTDDQGLPRVRFVFAGYRVTNRSQGAWSNWGLVLSLDPLEPEDAARLISAPLAVMGIDLGAHAHEVAYRCGYQPAILLRFGERLMDHLERVPHRSGDRHVVSPADLAQVLDDQRVHEEIRTIARNNFEGNPAGLLVFGALLRELLELPPGQPLRDGPQRIVERLRAIDADLSWLEREGDGSAAVRGYLADFVERSLLRERRVGGEPSYSLRFPHHLTILASLADEARMREELRRLRPRAEASAQHLERALVSPRVLRDLGDALQAGSGAIGVVGSLWPVAIYDRAGGVPDRLGVTTDETVDAQAILDGQRALATARAVQRVDVPAAEHIISELHSASMRPLLMGGVDVLRWALERRRESNDLLYEVHGAGRLSVARLTWWLQRVRGLEFARADAIERIHRRTGGMPLLLDVVDRQLATVAGTTVSDERVNLALGALDEAVSTLARDLVGGRPAILLEVREREILQMVECVVRTEASAGLDLRSSLTEMWELFADRCAIAPLGSSDAIPLEVLLELGLLPSGVSSRSEEPLARLGAILPDDPVLSLVRAFPPERR